MAGVQRPIALGGLLLAAVMALIARGQRVVNEKILSTLNDVNTALANQTTRSRELEQQVSMLSERVASLEKEVIDLRRRVVTLSQRPVVIARITPPLDVTPLAPMAPFSASRKPQAASRKPQAASRKPQAASRKSQAPS